MRVAMFSVCNGDFACHLVGEVRLARQQRTRISASTVVIYLHDVEESQVGILYSSFPWNSGLSDRPVAISALISPQVGFAFPSYNFALSADLHVRSMTT